MQREGKTARAMEDLESREIHGDRVRERMRDQGMTLFWFTAYYHHNPLSCFHSAVQAHLSPRLCFRHCDCLVFKKPSVSPCSDKCFSNTNHSWVHLIWICERGFDSISRMLLQARHKPFNKVATWKPQNIHTLHMHHEGFGWGLPSLFKRRCSLIPLLFSTLDLIRWPLLWHLEIVERVTFKWLGWNRSILLIVNFDEEWKRLIVRSVLVFDSVYATWSPSL